MSINGQLNSMEKSSVSPLSSHGLDGNRFKPEKVVSHEHLLDGEFADGIFTILDSDPQARLMFFRTCKRTIRQIKKLDQRGELPPVISDVPGEAMQEDSIFYRERITSLTAQISKLRKQWTPDEGRQCIDEILELTTPFYGAFDMEAEQRNEKSPHTYPLHVVKAYQDMVKRMVRMRKDSSQFGQALSRDLSNAGLAAFFTTEMATLSLMLGEQFMGLTKYVSNSFEIAMPFEMGLLYFLGSMTKSLRQRGKEAWNTAHTKVMSEIFSVMSLENQDVEAMLFPDYASQIRTRSFEAIMLSKEGNERNHQIGLGLLSEMFSRRDDKQELERYVAEIWGYENSAGHPVLKTVGESTLKRFSSLCEDESLLNRKKGLIESDKDRLERTTTEVRYGQRMLELIELLDHTLTLDENLHDGKTTIKPLVALRAFSLWNQPITRRKFLTGVAFGMGALYMLDAVRRSGLPKAFGSSLVDDYGYTMRKTIVDLDYSLAGPEVTEMITGHMREQLGVEYSTDALGTIPPDQFWVGKWLENSGSQLLQVHPSIYFNAREFPGETAPDSVDTRLMDKYRTFLDDEYFPYLFAATKKYGVDIPTMLGIMRISSENVTSSHRQNEDVKQSRQQLILGEFGLYMHRKFGTDLPIDTIKTLAYEALRGPYDTARLNGQITIGMQDVELLVYGFGLEAQPKQLRKDFDRSYPSESTVLQNLLDSYEVLDHIRSDELNRAIVELEINISTEDKKALFSLLDDVNHPDWDEIGLGKDPSFGDISRQTTRYSRVWKELCWLHGQGYDESTIFEQSFRNARDSFVHDNKSSDGSSEIIGFIRDQISNDKFCRWLRKRSRELKIGVNYVDDILDAFESFDQQGGYVLDDLHHAYRVVSEKEYDWKYQIDMSMGYMRFLNHQIEQSSYLRQQAEQFPLWRTFIATCVREISPFPLLVSDANDLPRMTEFDLPYNYTGVIHTVQQVAVGLQNMTGISDSEQLLRLTVELLWAKRTQSEDYIPDYVTNVPEWRRSVEPWVQQLDMPHYSSIWRAVDVMIDFLNYSRS